MWDLIGFGENEHKKISNTEWFLVFLAYLFVDIIQIVLDLIFGAGVAVNRFIDIIAGMSLGLYLQIRGQSLADPKRLFSLIGSFALEEVPILDALPLWCLDVVYNWSLYKGKEKLAELPIVGETIVKTLDGAVGGQTPAPKKEDSPKNTDVRKPNGSNVVDLRKKDKVKNISNNNLAEEDKDLLDKFAA